MSNDVDSMLKIRELIFGDQINEFNSHFSKLEEKIDLLNNKLEKMIVSGDDKVSSLLNNHINETRKNNLSLQNILDENSRRFSLSLEKEKESLKSEIKNTDSVQKLEIQKIKKDFELELKNKTDLFSIELAKLRDEYVSKLEMSNSFGLMSNQFSGKKENTNVEQQVQ